MKGKYSLTGGQVCNPGGDADIGPQSNLILAEVNVNTACCLCTMRAANLWKRSSWCLASWTRAEPSLRSQDVVKCSHTREDSTEQTDNGSWVEHSSFHLDIYSLAGRSLSPTEIGTGHSKTWLLFTTNNAFMILLPGGRLVWFSELPELMS